MQFMCFGSNIIQHHPCTSVWVYGARSFSPTDKFTKDSNCGAIGQLADRKSPSDYHLRIFASIVLESQCDRSANGRHAGIL